MAPSSASSLAAEADGDRADRVHVDEAGRLAEAPDLLDHAGGVGDRVGVGHRVHAVKPPSGGGLRAGQHGLGVLAARLAQVGVQVDEARQRDEAVGVDDVAARPSRAGADLGDDAVGHEEVDGLLAVGGGTPRST